MGLKTDDNNYLNMSTATGLAVYKNPTSASEKQIYKTGTLSVVVFAAAAAATTTTAAIRAEQVQ